MQKRKDKEENKHAEQYALSAFVFRYISCNFFCFAHIFSIILNLALRERGFSRNSSSLGVMGFL